MIFILLELTPGDPIQAIVGQFPVPEAFRAELEERFRLNDPFLVRFFSFFDNIMRGDLGYSFVLNQNVADVIAIRLPNTLLLATAGFALGILAGCVLGLISGLTSSHGLDAAISIFTIVAYSIPVFWLGQILVLIFSLHFGWLPTQGMSPAFSNAEGFDFILERLRYLALPMITYGIYETARSSRIARTSVIETIQNGYIDTAKLKGLSTWQIIRRHVIRNAAAPVVSVMGYSFAVAMGGAVLLETVFSWPGIGLLLIDAIRQRDNQVILGVVLVIAFAVIIINLIVDILHGLLDPRVRL